MAISSNATGLRPGVCTSTTRPTTPYTGQIIYETDTGYLRVWDGAAWDYLSQKQDDTVGLGPVGGLVLVKTQTIGTAVASVTVSNAFSSTYDNYYCTYTGGVTSAAAVIAIYMGDAALANSYYGAVVSANPSGTSLITGNNNVGQWTSAAAGHTAGVSLQLWFSSPNRADETFFQSMYAQTDLGQPQFGTYTGFLNNTTQYTSFTIDPAGAVTLTGGTIRVYGYRNS